MRYRIQNAAKGGGFVVTTTDDTGKVIATENAKDMKAALAAQKAQHQRGRPAKE